MTPATETKVTTEADEMREDPTMAKRVQIEILVILMAMPVSAVVRRVPSEYPDIIAAISACGEGDVVLVAPGVYAGPNSRRFAINTSITVRSEQGPLTCVLDGQGDAAGVAFRDQGDSIEAILDGFTITNGGGGGAIMCRHEGHAVIRNCIITGNEGFDEGVGIKIGRKIHTGPQSAGEIRATVSNCIITNNHSSDSENSYGGGVLCAEGNVLFRNCVISGNSAAYGGGVACSSAIARFENCIITDNRAFTGKGEQAYLGYAGTMCTMIECPARGDLVFASCCIRNDANSIFYDKFLAADPPWGPSYDFDAFGNIQADPRFARNGYWHWDGFWIDGDYHLKSRAGRWDPVAESWVRDDVTSPCIDAGDPTGPIGHEPFPTGGIINMGAYGGTPEASKAYFPGAKPCETIYAGDVNGDGKVDFKDLQIMALQWHPMSDSDGSQDEPVGR